MFITNAAIISIILVATKGGTTLPAPAFLTMHIIYNTVAGAVDLMASYETNEFGMQLWRKFLIKFGSAKSSMSVDC